MYLSKPVLGVLPNGYAGPRGGDGLTGVLIAATADLSGDEVATLPVVLCATDFGRGQARAFVAACGAGDRRLRPSDSLGLEAARLVAPFARATGWGGRCHALMTPRGAMGQAVRSARAVLAAGADAVALCEVRATDHGYATAAALVRATDPGTGYLPVPAPDDDAGLVWLWRRAG
jgi:hypothetical protein